MATITVSESTYARLKMWATIQNQTVEEAVAPMLEQMVPELAPRQDRIRAFESLTELVRSRADRYPPGFRVDDSRESIYEGCGE